MKALPTRTVLIVIFFLTFSSLPAYSDIDSRVALVIGNSAYKHSPLTNPVNDAEDMAAALESRNFRVIKSVDADRTRMRAAVRTFGDEINKGAVGLFFYAGHGVQVGGENYLVPIDADAQREDEVPDECLRVSSVLRKMQTAGNRLNIIILDACRNNPFRGSFRSNNRGLAKMDAPMGSILAYATAPGSVAADGSGENGLYTSMLLKHINTPGLKLEDVFKNVRIDVTSASGNLQVPWESSSLMGDFYFSPPKQAEPPTEEPAPVASDELEKLKAALEEQQKIIERLQQQGSTLPETEKITAKSLASPEEPKTTAALEKQQRPIETTKKQDDFPKEVIADPVVSADGRFIAYPNGIVRDNEKGQEWRVVSDKVVTYSTAKHAIAELTQKEGGWRVPTVTELKTIRDTSNRKNYIQPLIKAPSDRAWARIKTARSGAQLNFVNGLPHFSWQAASYSASALAVRKVQETE